MHGILVVNKPEGPTSFDVVRQVRRVYQTRKVGHGGTLDPLATGVLPVAVGHATRLLEFLMDGEKVYRATLRLGVITDTQDNQGRVLEERSCDRISPTQVKELLESLPGEIDQLPPMYSALKHQGQPLYKLARQGIEIERTPRRVAIRSIRLLSINLPELVFEVTCSKGTYVRTLIHDFGLALGCGAHMTALQRQAAMPFTLGQTVDFATLIPGQLPDRGWFTLLQAVAHLPQVTAGAKAVALLKDGVPPQLDQVASQGALEEDAVVAISADGVLLALARFAPAGRLDMRGDFALLKVFHY
jgi:tRNA pseudouridine55 synthase